MSLRLALTVGMMLVSLPALGQSVTITTPVVLTFTRCVDSWLSN